MVNNEQRPARQADLGLATKVLYVYVGLTAATLIALVIMSTVAPQLATQEAWGHQIIVVIFAVVLPLRMRAARRGNARAVRVVTIIALAVGAVNLVEALLPAFPVWMRIVMLAVAVIMVAFAGIVTGRIGAQPAAGDSAA